MSKADVMEQGIMQGEGPVIIGLTGPIGCGKSTLAAMLGELGGAVIDADALARDVTAPGQPALSAIRARFGVGVFEGSGARTFQAHPNLLLVPGVAITLLLLGFALLGDALNDAIAGR